VSYGLIEVVNQFRQSKEFVADLQSLIKCALQAQRLARLFTFAQRILFRKRHTTTTAEKIGLSMRSGGSLFFTDDLLRCLEDGYAFITSSPQLPDSSARGTPKTYRPILRPIIRRSLAWNNGFLLRPTMPCLPTDLRHKILFLA